MKFLKIIFIFIIALFLYACNDATDKDDLDINGALEAFMNEIPSTVDSDLEFKETYTYKDNTYSVIYTPDNLDVITNTGEINRGFKDITTNINVELSINGKSLDKSKEVVIPKISEDDLKELIITEIIINSKVTSDLDLPLEFVHNNQTAELTWISSNEEVITNEGVVNFKTTAQTATLSIEFRFEEIEYTFNHLYSLEIQALSNKEFVEAVANAYVVPTTVNSNISLSNYVNGVIIDWSSSHNAILTDKGIFTHPNEDTEITLTAVFIYKTEILEKNYNITALTIPHEERVNMALNTITFPETINSNLTLQTNFDYGVKGEWTSQNPDVISNTGIVKLTEEQLNITLVLKLTSGDYTMEKEFNLITDTISSGEIFEGSHHHIKYANDFDSNGFNNVVLEGNHLVLSGSATTGTYTSPVFKSNNFTTLVGSWAAVSSMTATAELKVRVRVNGSWSDYLAYGAFGLGLENKMFNQNGGVANLSADEVIINNSKTADAFQYQVVLKRNSSTDLSPKLSLVSAALTIPGYKYPVDISTLPNKVEYDLPNLYQIDVPTIGNLICSPTSSAMILMYHGHEFEDELPHRELSALLREYRSGIYGNWVFNTVGISAFGENAYVKRIYSIEELFHQVATTGPVALSVRGQTGRYYTAGHLLVVSGFEITDSGRFIIVHDPNLPEVEYRYSETIYNSITRNVIYVVETK